MRTPLEQCGVERREARIAYALVAVVTLAALAMRLAQIRESLWVDELHTAWVVADGVGQIPPRARAGNQSPLYFYAEWAAVRVGGLNESALRWPSILAGVALAPLSFALARRWTRSTAAGLAAAVIVAVDRDFLFYATEARVYALVQLLALVRVAVFVKVLNSPAAGWRGAYIALAATMFHLHYTTALWWSGEAAVVLLLRATRQPPAYRPRQFFLDSLGIALLCLPAAPHLAEIWERRDNWKRFVPHPIGARYARERLAPSLTPLACYLAPPLACLTLAALMQRRKRPIPAGDGRADLKRLTCILSVWMATPLFLAWALSIADEARLFTYRYLIASAALVPVLAGVLCGLARSRAWRIAAAATVTAAALISILPQYAAQFRHDRRLIADRDEDWRAAVAMLNASGDRLPVFVYADLIEAATYAASPDPLLHAFCLLPVSGIYRLDPARHKAAPLRSLGDGAIAPEQCDSLASHRGAWLLLRAPQRSPAQTLRRVQAIFANCGTELGIAEVRPFGGVTAIRVEVSSP